MSAIVFPAALTVGVLFASGIYLILSPDVQRVVFGFLLFSNGVNLAILASSGVHPESTPPLLPGNGMFADPLPQAFILTAIVIGMGAAAFLLAVAVRMSSKADA